MRAVLIKRQVRAYTRTGPHGGQVFVGQHFDRRAAAMVQAMVQHRTPGQLPQAQGGAAALSLPSLRRTPSLGDLMRGTPRGYDAVASASEHLLREHVEGNKKLGLTWGKIAGTVKHVLGELGEKFDLKEKARELKELGKQHGPAFLAYAVAIEVFEDLVLPAIFTAIHKPYLIPIALAFHSEPVLYPLYFGIAKLMKRRAMSRAEFAKAMVDLELAKARRVKAYTRGRPAGQLGLPIFVAEHSDPRQPARPRPGTAPKGARVEAQPALSFEAPGQVQAPLFEQEATVAVPPGKTVGPEWEKDSSLAAPTYWLGNTGYRIEKQPGAGVHHPFLGYAPDGTPLGRWNNQPFSRLADAQGAIEEYAKAAGHLNVSLPNRYAILDALRPEKKGLTLSLLAQKMGYPDVVRLRRALERLRETGNVKGERGNLWRYFDDWKPPGSEAARPEGPAQAPVAPVRITRESLDREWREKYAPQGPEDVTCPKCGAGPGANCVYTEKEQAKLEAADPPRYYHFREQPHPDRRRAADRLPPKAKK